MFARDKNRGNNKSSAYASGSITSIAEGTRINGDVDAEHDMRIDGHVLGNIFCKAKVVVGPAAIIDGDLQAYNADVFGTINGNVVAKDLLSLKSQCMINGNLLVGHLDIEPNAIFNGQCTMSGDQTTQLIPEKAKSFQEQEQ